MPGAAGGGTVRHLAQAQSRLSTLREEKKNMNPETTNTSDRETSGGKRKIIMKAQVPDAHHRPTAPVDETLGEEDTEQGVAPESHYPAL